MHNLVTRTLLAAVQHGWSLTHYHTASPWFRVVRRPEVPMPNSVTCGCCGASLNEDVGLKPEERTPCPTCGSMARRFLLEAEPEHVTLGELRIEFNALL